MQHLKPFFTRRNAVILTVFVVATVLLIASQPAFSAPDTPSDYFTCVPTGVATFDERVHVRCNAADPNGIVYFAACSDKDSANASRYLSIFTTAKVTGKNLGLYYDLSDTSGTSCGCSTSDCRVIWGAEVLP
jgi:hypothetical protein